MNIVLDKYLKIIIGLVLFSLIVIPTSHSINSFSVSLGSLNFDFYDFVFVSLIFISIISIVYRKKYKIRIPAKLFKMTAAFVALNFIYLLFGLFLYENTNQSLYDFRVVGYYMILLIPFNLLGFNSLKDLIFIRNIFLFGLFMYSILTFSYFILPDIHPYSSFLENDDFIGLGRIAFHQEYLFIIGVPICFKILISKNESTQTKFLILVFLIIFLTKLIIGMSRGLILIVLFATIISLNDNFKFSLKFKKIKIINFFKITAFLLLSIIILVNYIFPNIYENSIDILSYFISRFLGFFADDNSNFNATHIDNRYIMLIEGINQILKSGFLGFGYGYTFSIDHPEWYLIKLSFVDSSIVTILIRSGILSLILYLAIMLDIHKNFNHFSKNMTKDKNQNMKSFLNIFSRSVIIILLFSFINSFMVFSKSALIFLLLVSIINSIFHSERNIYSS